MHAVSGESRPCRFGMGAKSLAVIVKSGHRQVWSSADCASGNRPGAVVLAGHKPAVLRVSWDRRTSAPGCRGATHLVRPGEYKVTAVAGHLRSKPINVVLGAKGAPQP